MNHQEISELRNIVRLRKPVFWHPNGGKQKFSVSFIPDDMAPESLRGTMKIATGERFQLANLDVAHFHVREFSVERVPNPKHTPEVVAHFDKLHEQHEVRMDALPKIQEEGERALYRLLPIAQGFSGQCRYVAGFLLGLYNGQRFRFDLTDFRGVDHEIFNDCLAVLKMDMQPIQEVHQYFENGNELFEDLAERWKIKDYSQS